MSPHPPSFRDLVERLVGAAYVLSDPSALDQYGADALNRPHRPDLIVLPGSTAEVAALARLCTAERVPLTVRGGGTGYTGGAVPIHGGLLMSMERFNRILDIDEANLLAVVEPNVVTAELQAAVERVGLFYPPDPASLERSAIGGNVAECAGGPRAFKYGTTKHYVLGLEAVLPTGEIIHTGSKAVKNVVGYDLTHLLVGSEGTLAVITQIILRLVPKPPAHATLLASFATMADAATAVNELVRARVVPAALELVDRASLEALARYLGAPDLAPPSTGALLLIEVDGLEPAVREEAERVVAACRTADAICLRRAGDESERQELWRARRELSAATRAVAPLKFNHDVVVPKGRVPALFALTGELGRRHDLRILCFGHAGDGNIHVNIMADPAATGEVERAHRAERELFEGVVALEGSISGEHGIGFAKAPYLSIELGPAEIALMKRLKQAFDPEGILNPGKIFPE